MRKEVERTDKKATKNKTEVTPVTSDNGIGESSLLLSTEAYNDAAFEPNKMPVFEPDKAIKEKGSIEEFSSQKANNEVFEFQFPAVTKDGCATHILYDEDELSFEVRMRLEDGIKNNGEPLALDRRGDSIGRKIEVRVKEIDEKERVVYLEAVEKIPNENALLNKKRKQIENEIERLFAEAEGAEEIKIPVLARAAYITDDFVVLDIQESGINVFVYTKNWSCNHIPKLKDYVEKDAVYRINITARKPARRSRTKFLYFGEHRSYTENSWELVNQNILKKGSMITVRCIGVNESLSQWQGVCTSKNVLPPEVILFGAINKNKDSIRPIVGEIYECTIKGVDTKKTKKVIHVVPFRKLYEDKQS